MSTAASKSNAPASKKAKTARMQAAYGTPSLDNDLVVDLTGDDDEKEEEEEEEVIIFAQRTYPAPKDAKAKPAVAAAPAPARRLDLSPVASAPTQEEKKKPVPAPAPAPARRLNLSLVAPPSSQDKKKPAPAPAHPSSSSSSSSSSSELKKKRKAEEEEEEEPSDDEEEEDEEKPSDDEEEEEEKPSDDEKEEEEEDDPIQPHDMAIFWYFVDFDFSFMTPVKYALMQQMTDDEKVALVRRTAKHIEKMNQESDKDEDEFFGDLEVPKTAFDSETQLDDTIENALHHADTEKSKEDGTFFEANWGTFLVETPVYGLPDKGLIRIHFKGRAETVASYMTKYRRDWEVVTGKKTNTDWKAFEVQAVALLQEKYKPLIEDNEKIFDFQQTLAEKQEELRKDNLWDRSARNKPVDDSMPIALKTHSTIRTVRPKTDEERRKLKDEISTLQCSIGSLQKKLRIAYDLWIGKKEEEEKEDEDKDEDL